MAKKLKMTLLLVSILILLLSACAGDEVTKTTENDNKIFSESSETRQEIDIAETITINESTDDVVDNTWYFISSDLDGNEINSKDFFAKSELTLVNIWGTFCGPCKVELPDLGRIAREYADKDVQVLGITSDVPYDNENMIRLAQTILSESNVDYVNLTTNEDVANKILQTIFAVPTTYLINSDGIPISDPVLGAQSYEYFANLIEKGLSE